MTFSPPPRLTCRMLLAAYLAGVLCLTVVCRDSGCGMGCRLTPFWNYARVFSRPEWRGVGEIALNLFLLAPAGALLAFCVPPARRAGWLVAGLSGLLFSSFIEALQLLLDCGLCELDDVMHNTLGCVLGFLSARRLADDMTHNFP